MQKKFKVFYVGIVKAKSSDEARKKIAKLFERNAWVEEMKSDRPARDPDKTCPHGKLWHVYCDYC